MNARATTVPVFLLSAAILAGCLAPEANLGILETALSKAQVRILTFEGMPAAYAAVTAMDETGGTLLAMSADANGTLPFALLPSGTQRLAITAPGHQPWQGPLAMLPATLTLVKRVEPLSPGDPDPVLQFLPPIALGTAWLADQPALCSYGNSCGASEPSIEIAGDGTIYVTGVCCVGRSPPIWVSRDGGVTFSLLTGDALRDNFGIEGDFAIDDAGNLYFTDTSVASGYIASWDKAGKHRWTVPLGPFLPVVDRPWVRAGPENHVYFAYHQYPGSTAYYLSIDGGRTWALQKTFADGTGTLAQGPERARLWVVAGSQLYESKDEGKTWGPGERVKRPSAEGNRFNPIQSLVVDEEGRVYVVYDYRLKSPGGSPPQSVTDPKDDVPYHIYVNRRDPDGSWHGPFQVSPAQGTHHLPWAATGKGGTLTLAWYGTLNDAKGPNGVNPKANWYLFAATSLDAASSAPHFQMVVADPEPVHKGPMNRKLLDFLQIDVGPEGAVHIGYAQDRLGQRDEVAQYVGSTSGLRLNPSAFPNGPRG